MITARASTATPARNARAGVTGAAPTTPPSRPVASADATPGNAAPIMITARASTATPARDARAGVTGAAPTTPPSRPVASADAAPGNAAPITITATGVTPARTARAAPALGTAGRDVRAGTSSDAALAGLVLRTGALLVILLGPSACKPPPAPKPAEEQITVRILSKHHPRQLQLRGRGCELDPSTTEGTEAAAEETAATVPAESTAPASAPAPAKTPGPASAPAPAKPPGPKSAPTAPADPALRLSVVEGQVQVCVQRRCQRHTRVGLRCAAPMSLHLPALPPRRYGRRLVAEVHNDELRLIATLPLENYVAGVIRAELARAPPAAREAQAVLARSFALRAKAHPRHADAALCDLTHCQAFAGVPRSPSPAQAKTAGWVLRTPNGEVAATYYHSTCGGHTLAANALWDTADPAAVGISDAKPGGGSWCDASRHSFWMHEVTRTQLASALRGLFGRRPHPRSLRIRKTGPLRFTISDRSGRRSVSAERLHVVLGRKLGWSAVKSNDLRFEQAGRRFWIRGRGLGHRVGLCQHGAMARAEAGATAEQLLTTYFPKFNLDKP